MQVAKRKIVVVEDDLSMNQAIERILNTGGFAATTYVSAEEAFEKYELIKPDCLVLDIQLPGKSGFDLYRLLMSLGSVPPTIFITAHDEACYSNEANGLGASHFLVKPFSGRSLLFAVSQSVESA